jgi:hypothetical protein
LIQLREAVVSRTLPVAAGMASRPKLATAGWVPPAAAVVAPQTQLAATAPRVLLVGAVVSPRSQLAGKASLVQLQGAVVPRTLQVGVATVLWT